VTVEDDEAVEVLDDDGLEDDEEASEDRVAGGVLFEGGVRHEAAVTAFLAACEPADVRRVDEKFSVQGPARQLKVAWWEQTNWEALDWGFEDGADGPSDFTNHVIREDVARRAKSRVNLPRKTSTGTTVGSAPRRRRRSANQR
jgi:hypothetical protein